MKRYLIQAPNDACHSNDYAIPRFTIRAKNLNDLLVRINDMGWSQRVINILAVEDVKMKRKVK